MRHGFQGACEATVTACAAGTHSIGNALALIRSGRADAVVAGGAEAPLTPTSLAGFRNMTAMSKQGASMPFDARRDGFVIAEGGGVIILETQNVASRWAKLLGIRWQHYKFQEHLYHFDPKTIVTLLDQAGLERVEWSPRRGGKYVSFRFIAERASRIHPLVAFCLAPLKLLGERALYLNFFDEMLVVTRAKAEAGDG